MSEFESALSHCRNGHPFDEENTYTRTNGRRQCRVCTNASQRRYRVRAA